MYVVTREGHKLPVDDSEIDYQEDYISAVEHVGLFTDDVTLEPCWILNVYSKKPIPDTSLGGNDILNWEGEYLFDHKPTQEEILWHMSKHNMGYGDIAEVNQVYRLGRKS